MKVVTIGDIHYQHGHWRHADRVAAIDQILKQTASWPVSAYVQLGDIWEGRVSDEDLVVAADMVQRMATQAPTVLLLGNHALAGYSLLLRRLRAQHPIFVVESPHVLAVPTATGETLHVACIPYPNKGQLVAAGIAPADIGREAAQALDVICISLADELSRAQGPKLLIGHATIAGATASTGQPLGIEGDIAVSAAMLARFGPDVPRIFGHIHKPHVVHGAHYAGSVAAGNWGETEEKRWIVVEYGHGEPEILSHKLNTPRLYHAEGSIDRDAVSWKLTKGPDGPSDEPPTTECPDCNGSGDGRKDLLEGTLTCEGACSKRGNPSGRIVDWTGCDVRARIRYHQGERALLGDLRQRVEAEFPGARRVEVEPVAIQTRAARAPEVVAAKTLPEKLQAWARLSGVSWSDEIERCAEALLATEDGETVVAETEARLEAHVRTSQTEAVAR